MMENANQNFSPKRRISFIVINYNTRELVLSCIQSIKEHAGQKFDYEIWLVDNASSDGSIEAVAGTFPDVLIIGNQENMGFARANNMALKKADGEVVVLLNSDARLTAGAIEAMYEVLESDQQVAVVGGQLLNVDGSSQNSIDNTPTLLTELCNKSLLRKLFPRIYPSKYRHFETPSQVHQVIGACMMLRRAAIEQVGLFDEGYFFFMEETDWQLRFRKAGWKIIHQPHARIYHEQGKSANRRPASARIEFYRSRYRFFVKHYGFLVTGLLMAGLFLKLIIGFVVNVLGQALMFGMSGALWRRLRMQGALLGWHLLFFPKTWGLKKGTKK